MMIGSGRCVVEVGVIARCLPLLIGSDWVRSMRLSVATSPMKVYAVKNSNTVELPSYYDEQMHLRVGPLGGCGGGGGTSLKSV